MKIDIVNVLIIHKKKILAVKRVSKDNVFGGMWALPGGGIKKDETMITAAKRELLEEAGIKDIQLNHEICLYSPLNIQGQVLIIGIIKGTTNQTEFVPDEEEIDEVSYIEPYTLISSLNENKYPKEEVLMLKDLFKKEKLF